jgi:hypothetical protein
VPRWPPLHPEFREAIRVLDSDGLSYAELWRRLIPVAARIGEPRPSYWMVRRLAIAERRRARARAEYLERVLTDLARGVVPRF